MRTWKRRRARTCRRRHCWGSWIATGSIFFVNVVRVMCTRQSHAWISFSAWIRIGAYWKTSADAIELDWTRLKLVQTIRVEYASDSVCSADRPLVLERPYAYEKPSLCCLKIITWYSQRATSTANWSIAETVNISYVSNYLFIYCTKFPLVSFARQTIPLTFCECTYLAR